MCLTICVESCLGQPQLEACSLTNAKGIVGGRTVLARETKILRGGLLSQTLQS